MAWMVSFDLATAPNWKQHSNLPWFSSKWSRTFLPKLPLRYNTKLTCSLSLLRAVHAVMAVPFLVSMSARSVRRRAVSSEIITSITKNITVYTRWTCRWKNRIMQYNWLPVTRILMLNSSESSFYSLMTLLVTLTERIMNKGNDIVCFMLINSTVL